MDLPVFRQAKLQLKLQVSGVFLHEICCIPTPSAIPRRRPNLRWWATKCDGPVTGHGSVEYKSSALGSSHQALPIQAH